MILIKIYSETFFSEFGDFPKGKNGGQFFFQNFEEKYPIIILRPKWANLGVK